MTISQQPLTLIPIFVSSRTSGDVSTTVNFTKSVDALVYYIDPENEKMRSRTQLGPSLPKGAIVNGCTTEDFTK